MISNLNYLALIYKNENTLPKKQKFTSYNPKKKKKKKGDRFTLQHLQHNVQAPRSDPFTFGLSISFFMVTDKKREGRVDFLSLCTFDYWIPKVLQFLCKSPEKTNHSKKVFYIKTLFCL